MNEEEGLCYYNTTIQSWFATCYVVILISSCYANGSHWTSSCYANGSHCPGCDTSNKPPPSGLLGCVFAVAAELGIGAPKRSANGSLVLPATDIPLSCAVVVFSAGVECPLAPELPSIGMATDGAGLACALRCVAPIATLPPMAIPPPMAEPCAQPLLVLACIVGAALMGTLCPLG